MQLIYKLRTYGNKAPTTLSTKGFAVSLCWVSWRLKISHVAGKKALNIKFEHLLITKWFKMSRCHSFIFGSKTSGLSSQNWSPIKSQVASWIWVLKTYSFS